MLLFYRNIVMGHLKYLFWINKNIFKNPHKLSELEDEKLISSITSE